MTYTTTLPPDQASQQIAVGLASRGATVTTASPQLIAGNVAWKKHPSIIVGVLLLCLAIIPGLLWFLFAGKKGVDPFAVTLTPNGTGTNVDSSGTGRGLKACDYAIGGLPR